MLFPGHGAEVPRMGLELAAVHPPAARLLDHAGECGGFDPAKVLRRGGDQLSNTQVLQPLMTAVLLGIVDALAAEQIHADVALGHSLGELSAWAALGGIAPQRAIELAAVRGRALQAIAAEHVGAMLALSGLSPEQLDEALALGRHRGSVDLALHSAPEGWVVSGDRDAVRAIEERHGGSIVPTSGAWHCARMTAARPAFEAGLQAVADAVQPTPTLICNQTGDWLGDADVLPLLLEQIDSPVRFAPGMQVLAQARPRVVVAVGPPKVLRSLVRANWGEAAGASVLVAETPREIAKVVEALR